MPSLKKKIQTCRWRMDCFRHRKCTELDPFVFTMLASSCMGVFKTLFLKKDTRSHVWRCIHRSVQGIFRCVYTMVWISESHSITIKHAINQGEHQTGLYFVDGYQPDTKKCYEFAGYFYHRCVRCIRCYAQASLNPLTRETYGILYGQFMSKLNDLKVRYGHEVEVM